MISLGNVAVVAGRVTRIREGLEDELRYLRLVGRDGPTGMSAGMNPAPFSCVAARCLAGARFLAPLTTGTGAVVRDTFRLCEYRATATWPRRRGGRRG